MNLSGKAIMMVMAMLMMKMMTRMTMMEIMMVITMMVVMLLTTDFLLKRRKSNRFVCLFVFFYNIQIIRMSDLGAFQKKNANRTDNINPLGFHCFLRDKTYNETTRQLERVSISLFRLECRMRNREAI